MLRELDIPADWVAEHSLGALAEILGSGLEPEEARELQGTILLAFPELEVEDASIFSSPGVVEWLAMVHRRIPHLLYFLEPSPMSGAFEGLMRAIVSPEVTVPPDPPPIPLTPQPLAKLSTHLSAASAFGIDNGDDWRPIIGRFLAPLDAEVRTGLIEVVRHDLDDLSRAR